MTTITVTNAAQLNSALTTAKAGDTISLAGGNYGDLYISKAFSSDVTITSQSASAPAVFSSVNLNGASHIKLDTISVNYVPNSSTYSFSPAVKINNASDITFVHSTVTGGNAVNGVAQTATTLDSTGNVLGLPTGYGVLVTGSNGVKVDGVEVSNFYKGIVLNASDNVTISHNDVHDTRTTGIVAGGGNNITIDSNHIHDINPWNWGAGDHADFLAMWTNAGQTSASNNITISNNLMEQGKGTAVLGMWMQGGAVGYTNVSITGNAILNGNFQGITLWDVHGASVDHNTLLQTSGSDWKSAPGILLSGGTQNISTHDNTTGSYNDQSGATGAQANTAASNSLVQKWTPTAAGYYTNALIVTTESAHDIGGLYGVTGSVVTSVVTATTSAVTATTPTASAGAATTTPAAAVTTTPTVDTTVVGKAIDGNWNYQSLTGTSGNDTFTSKSGGDTLSGGAGDDTYYITAGKTVIIEAAGGGIDTVVAKGDYTLPDNVENLTISDTATNNWTGTGNSLNNVIKGNAGNNYLDGGAGNDTINGGAGNDTIVGGTGNDLLTGGTGKDTFVFAKGSGVDTITDFSKVDHDVIDISGYLKAGYKATLVDVGADVKISFSTGDAIILTGVHAKDLIATSTGFTI